MGASWNMCTTPILERRAWSLAKYESLYAQRLGRAFGVRELTSMLRCSVPLRYRRSQWRWFLCVCAGLCMADASMLTSGCISGLVLSVKCRRSPIVCLKWNDCY